MIQKRRRQKKTKSRRTRRTRRTTKGRRNLRGGSYSTPTIASLQGNVVASTSVIGTETGTQSLKAYLEDQNIRAISGYPNPE